MNVACENNVVSEQEQKSTAEERQPSAAEYCHERLGSDFASALSDYDTSRRVRVLVDEFLSDPMVDGKRILDVGCGLGFFSARLMQRGAEVVACDLGASLVTATRQRAGCRAEVADALQLERHFGPATFDGVVSSECIEHTPSPRQAIEQMTRVVKPGGFLSISTPNLLWYPVVATATRLGLRPFDGLENFSTWGGLRRTLREADCEIVHERGLHLFPFQLPLHGLSTWCDEHLQSLRPLMINLCLLAQKSASSK